MQTLALLCQKISTYFQDEMPPNSIEDFCPLVQAYQGLDWKDYVAYSDECYSRHYIVQNQDFEMLILCWKPGQGSPIHNHAERGCVLKVLEGQLLETRYLGEEVKETLLLSGDLTYIDDQIGWHKINNLGNKPTVSLHVYSPGYFIPEILVKEKPPQFVDKS